MNNATNPAIAVLAVMHQESVDADQYRGLFLPERLKERRQESDEARAAVAELIEAAGAGRNMRLDGGRESMYFSPNLADRLRAALARVQP